MAGLANRRMVMDWSAVTFHLLNCLSVNIVYAVYKNSDIAGPSSIPHFHHTPSIMQTTACSLTVQVSSHEAMTASCGIHRIRISSTDGRRAILQASKPHRETARIVSKEMPGLRSKEDMVLCSRMLRIRDDSNMGFWMWASLVSRCQIRILQTVHHQHWRLALLATVKQSCRRRSDLAMSDWLRLIQPLAERPCSNHSVASCGA